MEASITHWYNQVNYGWVSVAEPPSSTPVQCCTFDIDA